MSQIPLAELELDQWNTNMMPMSSIRNSATLRSLRFARFRCQIWSFERNFGAKFKILFILQKSVAAPKSNRIFCVLEIMSRFFFNKYYGHTVFLQQQNQHYRTTARGPRPLRGGFCLQVYLQAKY